MARLTETLQKDCERMKKEALKKVVDPSLIRDALDSSVNGVLIADPQGHIAYVNPAFLRMFEYEGEMEEKRDHQWKIWWK